jgi:hypothetical protein
MGISHVFRTDGYQSRVSAGLQRKDRSGWLTGISHVFCGLAEEGLMVVTLPKAYPWG